MVADGVERGDLGADGNGLANADVAGDDADCSLADTVGDAGHRLLVGVTQVEVGGRDGL
jgi:hypothetical protein